MTADDLEIEQYKSLRGEILRLMEDGNSIINYSLLAFGAIIAGGLTLKNTLAGFFAYAVLLPVFSSIFFSLWYAAYERLARASYFITGIERRLKISVGAPSLPMWDSWLRGDEKRETLHFWSFENSGALIFGAFMTLPIAAAFVIGGSMPLSPLKVTIGILMLFYDLVFMKNMRVRVARAKNWLTSHCPD